MTLNLRKVYLYLFSAVGLIIALIGAVQIVNLVLKIFVFKQADFYPIYEPRPIPVGQEMATSTAPAEAEIERQKREQEYQRRNVRSQREREAANAVAMIIIGLPLYLYHWRLVQREKEI